MEEGMSRQGCNTSMSCNQLLSMSCSQDVLLFILPSSGQYIPKAISSKEVKEYPSLG